MSAVLGDDRKGQATTDGGPGRSCHFHPQLMKTSAAAERCPTFDFEELELMSRVGRGSSADIYSAKLRGELVAIKVYHNRSNGSHNGRDQAARGPLRVLPFQAVTGKQREIAMLSSLKHHNIVNLIGVSETPSGQTCVVMEYMKNGSLRDVYQREGPMPHPLVRKTALAIARAMALLHSRGILHRDLKADNVLLDDLGNVKLADFGLSRVKAEGSASNTFETGSYRWMAPEIIEHKPYDEKADIYSFGILLWELLAGQVPYPNHTPIQAAFGVLNSNLRPPVQLGVPPDLRKLMLACWHKKPRRRPSFLDIIRILQDYELRGSHQPSCFALSSARDAGTDQQWSKIKGLSQSLPQIFRFPVKYTKKTFTNLSISCSG